MRCRAWIGRMRGRWRGGRLGQRGIEARFCGGEDCPLLSIPIETKACAVDFAELIAMSSLSIVRLFVCDGRPRGKVEQCALGAWRDASRGCLSCRFLGSFADILHRDV